MLSFGKVIVKNVGLKNAKKIKKNKRGGSVKGDKYNMTKEHEYILCHESEFIPPEWKEVTCTNDGCTNKIPINKNYDKTKKPICFNCWKNNFINHRINYNIKNGGVKVNEGILEF